MLSNSTGAYLWVRFWVIVLHSIAPICVLYCILALFLPSSLRLPSLLEYLALAETVFYFLTFLYRKYHLERSAVHPPLPSMEERHKLFELCQNSTPDPVRYIRKWFLDAPLNTIKRENVKEFFRWAFLNTDKYDPANGDEIDGYVQKLETQLGRKFEPGRANVKCLRLTLDEVNSLHRSLIWYMCIFVVETLTQAYMIFHGFQFHRSSMANSLGVIPPRLQALLASHQSPAKDLTYWYLPHTSKKELPVVFLHGIGVGLYPYMEFLKELNHERQLDEQIGILAIENLPISSRITSPALRKDEMCHQVRTLVRHHGFERYVLVSHSYGSVISTHLLKTPDLARQISSVILVDPVSILLHQPDVAYNFIIRAPKSAPEWLLWYFGSKDMGVAHTLSRTFFWSENILWKEDIIDHHATVFLAGKDSIINAPLVRAYLIDGDHKKQQSGNGTLINGNGALSNGNGTLTPSKSDRMQPRVENYPVSTELAGDGRLKVVWAADMDHGQIFDLAGGRGRLRREVLMQARNGSYKW